MSEFIPSPSDSTKIELKADDSTKSQIDEVITPSIDAPDNTDLHLDKISELRDLLKDLNNDYTDRDCERFLIARSFDLTKAFAMITKHHDWYNTPLSSYKIDNPSLRPRDMGFTETDNKQEAFNSLFPCSCQGQDKEGHPIYWEKSGKGK
jgi:hypothetical protein